MAVKLSTGDVDELEVSHEINVTPFIDVILVLLIIFMVAAPLSTVDVNVELPTSTARPTPRPDRPVFITLKADRTLTVGDDDVTRGALAAAIDHATTNRKDQRIFVRADKAVGYGEVMSLLDALRDAGYLKIGLIALDDPRAVGAASKPAELGGAP